MCGGTPARIHMCICTIRWPSMCVLRKRKDIQTNWRTIHAHNTCVCGVDESENDMSERQEKENLISSFSIVLAFVHCSVRVSFAAHQTYFFVPFNKSTNKKIEREKTSSFRVSRTPSE